MLPLVNVYWVSLALREFLDQLRL